MLDIFYESPWFALITGIPVCVLLIAIWFQTGIHKILLATGVVAAITIAMVVLESVVKTPRERIYETIYAVAAAVEKEDFETAVGYIAPDAQFIRAQALAELNKYEIVSISIKNNLVVLIDDSQQPPVAQTGFNVVVKGSAQRFHIENRTVPRYLEVTFQYHAGNDAWYVTSYGHANILKGLEIEHRLREQGAE